MTLATSLPASGSDDRPGEVGTRGGDATVSVPGDEDAETAPHPRAPRRTGGSRASVDVGEVPPAGITTFAGTPCRRHRGWVVDRTEGDLLPAGWRELASRAFADPSAVGCGRRFALARLRAERGELVVSPVPRGRPKGGDACVSAVDVVLSQAVAASRLTCQTCGGPGAFREDVGETPCDPHAAGRTTDGVRGAGFGRRPRGGGPDHVGAVASLDPDRRVAMFDVRDVAAAVGRHDGADDDRRFLGDPEQWLADEPDTEQTAYLRRILRGDDDVPDRLATASPLRVRHAVVEAMACAASIGRRVLRIVDVVVEPRASGNRGVVLSAVPVERAQPRESASACSRAVTRSGPRPAPPRGEGSHRRDASAEDDA